jgi:ATP-dependent RNA helicase DeaD
MPPAIRKVANKYLTDAVEIQVEDTALSVDHIEQQWLVVPHRHKVETLERLLQMQTDGTTLVFARTRISCSEITEELTRKGYSVDTLHSDVSQPARERVMRRMRSGQLKLVVATDVAARGLDVNHLSLVINLDIPESKEVYVHRIGRTGRAGRKGMAITFATPIQQRFVERLERELKVPIKRIDVPSDAEIAMVQRSGLAAKLAASPEPNANGFRWLRDLMEQHNWTAEEAAARALQMIAEKDGIALTADKDCSTEPPPWAKIRGGGSSRDRDRDRDLPGRRDRNQRPHRKKLGQDKPVRKKYEKDEQKEKADASAGARFAKSKKAKKAKKAKKGRKKDRFKGVPA